MQHQSPSLAFLAFTLSTWVEGERAAYCQAWAAYWGGTGNKPGKLDAGGGVPRKDSDYHVFSDALACVKFGWEGKAAAHLARVQMRMKATPLLNKFPVAARVGTPQPRDGKE